MHRMERAKDLATRAQLQFRVPERGSLGTRLQRICSIDKTHLRDVYGSLIDSNFTQFLTSFSGLYPCRFSHKLKSRYVQSDDNSTGLSIASFPGTKRRRRRKGYGYNPNPFSSSSGLGYFVVVISMVTYIVPTSTSVFRIRSQVLY